MNTLQCIYPRVCVCVCVFVLEQTRELELEKEDRGNEFDEEEIGDGSLSSLSS
jgi:formate hydrogenlyase subunit 6/NADH:ubiquinone oxidoreductase subunit I